jgi:hypothetical protein
VERISRGNARRHVLAKPENRQESTERGVGIKQETKRKGMKQSKQKKSMISTEEYKIKRTKRKKRRVKRRKIMKLHS